MMLAAAGAALAIAWPRVVAEAMNAFTASGVDRDAWRSALASTRCAWEAAYNREAVGELPDTLLAA